MMIIGTSHFPTRTAAINYYAEYGYDDVAATVDRKIKEGEIHISRPPLKPGQRLRLIDDGARFAIFED